MTILYSQQVVYIFTYKLKLLEQVTYFMMENILTVTKSHFKMIVTVFHPWENICT